MLRVIFLALSDSIDGGGWKLVRRVKKGSTWHPAAEQLTGVAEYGTPGNETSDETFSIRFDTTTFNQFLFATGKTESNLCYACIGHNVCTSHRQ